MPDIVSLIIEEYGPIGVLAVVLAYRQSRMIDAILLLAEQHGDVDTDDVEGRVRIRSD